MYFFFLRGGQGRANRKEGWYPKAVSFFQFLYFLSSKKGRAEDGRRKTEGTTKGRRKAEKEKKRKMCKILSD